MSNLRSIVGLPNEILYSIFTYLDFTDLRALRRCSRRLKEVAGGDAIGAPFLEHLQTRLDAHVCSDTYALRAATANRFSLRANRLWQEASHEERPRWQRLSLAPIACTDYAARYACARTIAPMLGLAIVIMMGPIGLGVGFLMGDQLKESFMDADPSGPQRAERRRAVRKELNRLRAYRKTHQHLSVATRKQLGVLYALLKKDEVRALSFRRPLLPPKA